MYIVSMYTIVDVLPVECIHYYDELSSYITTACVAQWLRRQTHNQ